MLGFRAIASLPIAGIPVVAAPAPETATGGPMPNKRRRRMH